MRYFRKEDTKANTGEADGLHDTATKHLGPDPGGGELAPPCFVMKPSKAQ